MPSRIRADRPSPFRPISARFVGARDCLADFRQRWTFLIAAICGIAGILCVFFFVPDLKGEDLANEDARFQAYLVANGTRRCSLRADMLGWEGEVGEDDDKHLVVAADRKMAETPDRSSL